MRKVIQQTAAAAALSLTLLPAQAAVWELDQSQSFVIFKYAYEGTPYEGQFGNVSATFDIDPLKPGSCNFDVTIPIEDINVDSPETLDYLLDLEMFDVDQWPTATFKAESCSLDSLNSFTSEGTLTIRDQTHPISFPFTLDIETCDGQVCFHLTSEVTVNRLDFGVGQGYWANTATIPNEVGIEIDVYAVQK